MLCSVGQTRAALGAAAGQNLAAVGGSHPLAEAMDLLAVELLGLIGTFRSHFETPPVSIASARGAALTRHRSPSGDRRSKLSTRPLT